MPNLPDNIGEITGYVLGQSVDDSAAHFITTGPVAERNMLTTTERVPTRAINALDTDFKNVEDAVNAFAARINKVVGKEDTEDVEALEALGNNLIQAVADLKVQMEGVRAWFSDITREDISELF